MSKVASPPLVWPLAGALACILLAGAGFAQSPSAGMAGMQGMDSAHSDPHMVMTALRPANTADSERAAEIVTALRASIEKYKDYRAALADGYRIFAPQLPEREKHFTNWRYAIEAQFKFDPAHPTSLLYDRTADGGWKLAGAMYTAPRRYSEEQLNRRVPLSVAHWHRHVNFCFPPKAALQQIRQASPGQPEPVKQEWARFLPITDEPTCRQEGGRWIPQLFGWMVHVYPFETDLSRIWSVREPSPMPGD
ncbi:MAG TPA: hypothetical protein VGS20_03145 [Candidatus Acidoferrales bacterium]|nr:hypothetical protein [Candidatus Acidoferrales bacterium]